MPSNNAYNNYKNIDVDQTEDEVSAGACQITWMMVVNMRTTVRFLKLYDGTAATVVVGTTEPTLTIPIPAQADGNGGGFIFQLPHAIEFTTALTIAATTGVADADTGAPGANEVVVAMGYK